MAPEGHRLGAHGPGRCYGPVWHFRYSGCHTLRRCNDNALTPTRFYRRATATLALSTSRVTG
jgi:hypothetical protein